MKSSYGPVEYIAYDNNRVIWGLGYTVKAALEDAQECLDEGEQVSVTLSVCECTNELGDLIEKDGGDIPNAWEIKKGIAMVKLEYRVAADL